MRPIALVLDLDNTLYSWMDAFAPSLDAQITYITKRTGKTKKCIRESFKKVFCQYGSVEIVDVAAALDIWEETNLADAEIEDIKEQSTKIFYEVFTDNLNLFPTVLETLEWAKKNNIQLFAFSDGHAYWIDFRLEYLNIAHFFERIYVLEDEQDNEEKSSYIKQIITLPESKIKPNSFILDEIMSDYHVLKGDVYVIGDSKNKDIRAAKLAGVKSIWAQYGLNYSQKSRQLMSSITPWTRSRISGGNRIVPQYTIMEFAEIRDIIEL